MTKEQLFKLETVADIRAVNLELWYEFFSNGANDNDLLETKLIENEWFTITVITGKNKLSILPVLLHTDEK